MLSPQLEREMKALLNGHVLFSLLDETATASLLKEVELVSFAIGETIIREGEVGDSAWLIFSGRVRVFRDGPDGKPITLASLARGELLGEHAMLKDEPRSASARAADDSVLLRIRRETFTRLLQSQPDLRPFLEKLIEQRALARFLQTGTLLGGLPARQIVTLLDQFEDLRFTPRQPIVSEGETGQRMFIIKSGEAKVVRGAAQEVLAYLGPSDFFGERALLLDEPRYASVIALSDTECAALSRSGFEQLLAQAPELKKQLSQRLRQYSASAELASNFGIKPAAPSAGERDIVWHKPEEIELPRPGVRQGAWHGWFGAKRRPFVPQEDENDCGAAALAMVALFHKAPISVARLRYLANVGARGASMLSVTAAAEAIGFDWRAVTTDYTHLADMPLPAIVHWKGCHYLVLYEAVETGVLLGDPAIGLVRLPRPEFEKDWTGNLLLLTPTERLANNRPARSAWQQFTPLLTGRKTACWMIAALSVLLAAALTVVPLLVQWLVDSQARSPAILELTLWFIPVAILLTLRQIAINNVVSHVGVNLRRRASARLLDLPARFFEAQRTGALLAPSDSPQPTAAALRASLTAVADLLLVPAGLGLLACYHIGWASLTLAAMSCSVIALCLAARKLFPLQQQIDRQESSLRSEVLETVENIDAIKACTAEAERCGKAERLLTEATATRHRMREILISLQSCFILLIGGFCIVSYAVVKRSDITPGPAAGAVLAWLLSVVPLWRLLGSLPRFLQLQTALRQAADLEDLPCESGGAAILPPLRRSLRCVDVSFSHQPETPRVLAHLSIELTPRRIHWLVGRAGAGKTTLAELLLGLRVPSEGTILVDGVDLRSADLSSWRQQIAFVPHEPVILHGAIRANIALTEADAKLERIIAAARLAGAHDFIMRLPLGYETPVGKPGVQLSSGEKYKLNLARAFFKDARLLILDEPTAFLDMDARTQLIKNLRLLSADRILLIVTNKPADVAPEDWVVVLDDGQVAEQGSPGDLIRRGGLFAYLQGQGVMV